MRKNIQAAAAILLMLLIAGIVFAARDRGESGFAPNDDAKVKATEPADFSISSDQTPPEGENYSKLLLDEKREQEVLP